MMDLQKERQAFEKLPDINAILHNSEFGFNEDINQYYHPNHTEHRLSYAFLMGAWSAWQAAKAQAIPEGFVVVNKKELAKVLNCVTDDWLIDTDSVQEFKKIESLVQDEVNAMFGSQE